MTIGHEVTTEFATIERRTRKLVGLSVGIHVILLVLLALHKTYGPEEPRLVEITWIEPSEVPAPAITKAVVKHIEESQPEVARVSSSHQTEEKFSREPVEAAVEPEPQALEAVQDQMSKRLAALQRQAAKPKPVTSIQTPSPIGRPKLAGVDAETRTPRRAELTREGNQSTPQPLTHTKPRVQAATVLATALPEPPTRRAERAESDAQRSLAGAQMTGPVADRPIIDYESPDYPEWAKREGVEGSVMIYFIVLPDGRVKENVMVEKTSGFSDFDNNAMNAILSWRFQPLPPGKSGEQWGTIMFHYRLSDAN